MRRSLAVRASGRSDIERGAHLVGPLRRASLGVVEAVDGVAATFVRATDPVVG